MAQQQKSLRDFLPVKRKSCDPEKKRGEPALHSLAVKRDDPPEKNRDEAVLASPPHTPKKRRIDASVCPRAPEPVSRGKMLVQMARQKALSTTPTRSSAIQPVSPRDSSEVRQRRRKLTARRRLVPPLKESEEEEVLPGIVASSSIEPTDRVSSSLVSWVVSLPPPILHLYKLSSKSM